MNDLKLTILHIITDLDTGGAESMLVKLTQHTSSPSINHIVLSLREEGELTPRFLLNDIPCYSLGIKTLFPGPISLFRLIRTIQACKPDIIQGWMYHGNIAATIGKLLSGHRQSLLWNIRQSLYEYANEKKTTQIIIKLGALLSKLPEGVIFNSTKSRDQHLKQGYKPSKTEIIPNGFDCSHFHPNPQAVQQLRKKLSVPQECAIIGHFARYRPMKDHKTLLEAVAKLIKTTTDVRVLLVGGGTDKSQALQDQINALSLEPYVQLLGNRTDIVELMQGCSIITLSSAWGEGFPNVIGEAMACGIPCVATDVGDTARLLDECGIIVPPKNSDELAKGWAQILSLDESEYQELSAKSRQRITEHYQIQSIAKEYVTLYQNITFSRQTLPG